MKDTKKRFPQVDVIGYTTNVDYYMRKADLIVTKSGGITTFEAINIGTPLYILKPFLVQEIGNAKYIEKNNIGRIMWSKKINIADDIISLLENKLVLKSMRSNMKNLQKKWDTTYSLSYFDKSGEII